MERLKETKKQAGSNGVLPNPPTAPETKQPGPRVLMLVPSVAKTGIEAEVAANQHPMMDYHGLQEALNRQGHADLADYALLDTVEHSLVRAARRAGRDAGLAMYGFLNRDKYDVIFTNGENVSIPLAALLRTVRRRPRHVFIGHRLSPAKKKPFLRKLHRQMDAIFVYAETQRLYAVHDLGIPERKLHLIPFHADHRFYQPVEQPPLARPMICSAGLEWRDYPTMLAAVEGMALDVRLAAASPWSKHKNETEKRELPPNVTAKRYNYAELRDLYAAAHFVVVPLYDNDFQAGVTTMLEAMAMGKAVIVTRTEGQRDVIQDGVNGVYVPPADPVALRAAIQRLLDHPEEAARIGANARHTIEQHMSLESWIERIARVLRATALERA